MPADRPASPAPQTIAAARKAAAMSQDAAAELVYVARRTWQDWEAGKAAMPPGLWELFEIKTAWLKAGSDTV